MRKILVAVDYSEGARLALEQAVELSKKVGAEITVVHVWERPAYAEGVEVRHEGESGRRSLIELIVDNADREMQSFIEQARVPASVKIERRLESGDPASVVARLVEQEGFDLVVLGTHGRSALAHLVLGSMAQRILRSCPVPVLVVPKRAHLAQP
jgi:nucleotide-binding universal stress UspA family protein